jgi:hypothetical protein
MTYFVVVLRFVESGGPGGLPDVHAALYNTQLEHSGSSLSHLIFFMQHRSHAFVDTIRLAQECLTG